MTQCIAVTVAGGLVLGADSMTVIKTETLSKQYSNADKVFEVPNLPIVVMTYGLGAIGRRSISSLLEEWADGREAYEKGQHTVEGIASDICGFVFHRHTLYLDRLRSQLEQRQAQALGPSAGEDVSARTAAAFEEVDDPFDAADYRLGIVVGGYQPDSRYPWLYMREEPAREGMPKGLTCVRPHEGLDGEDGPRPGVDYWGDTVALDRLYRGCDANLLAAASPVVRDVPMFFAAVNDQAWPIVFEGMPLKDAADLVQFMLHAGSMYERFKEGVPQIGGDLDIVVVTRNRTYWVSRKAMSAALSGLRAVPEGVPSAKKSRHDG